MASKSIKKCRCTDGDETRERWCLVPAGNPRRTIKDGGMCRGWTLILWRNTDVGSQLEVFDNFNFLVRFEYLIEKNTWKRDESEMDYM